MRPALNTPPLPHPFSDRHAPESVQHRTVHRSGINCIKEGLEGFVRPLFERIYHDVKSASIGAAS